jgi:hypothetical protein
MIFKSQQNTPVTAPQFSNMTAALEAYKTFKSDQTLILSDFLIFCSTPSMDRDEFLELFTADVAVVDDTYATVTYGND